MDPAEQNYPIRLLTLNDIPAAMRLKEAAGWNQTPEDWTRLLTLAPGGCFGIDRGGELASTATLICYGTDLAWLGMVLTLPEHRGHGLARQLFSHCLEYAVGLGISWVKLDATDMGRGLYAGYGFEDECPIERWLRPAGPCARAGPVDSGWDRQLDLEQFGAARASLLASLAAVECASIAGGGFAMGRPGSRAVFFGPCVSRNAVAAGQLLDWFVAQHAGEAICWDLFPDHADATSLARSRGFAPARRLMRMVRRGPGVVGAPPVNGPGIYAAAGFELG